MWQGMSALLCIANPFGYLRGPQPIVAMSSTPDLIDLPTSNALPPLQTLRRELDRIDNAIHDLLMERARVVGDVAELAARGKVPFRPGREAQIIRRLLRRHTGNLPSRLLARVWRELFAAATAMQGPFLITVCESGGDGAQPGQYVQCAREHFGALTPLRVHRSPAQAIGEVSAGLATAAVLPMPVEEDTAATAWWTALLHRDEPRIHVVGRLPFWAQRSEGAPQVQALVIAASAPDSSAPGDDALGNDAMAGTADCSLIGLELSQEMSRARLSSAITGAGFGLRTTILRRDPNAQVAYALVELDGYITEDDPRLAAMPEMLRPPVVLGAYAVPVEGENC
jgi:chorismate mutase/prephenate dehydratase